MKIECLKDKLLNILNKASKISSSKNLNLPILNCLILEGKSNKLTVKSTNLEIGVILNMPAKVEKEGIVAVQGDILNNLISTLSDSKNLKIESLGEQLKIISEKSETSIKTKDHEDFPTIPQMKPESFNISVESFISGLKSVWYSCATSSIKPELSSVLFYNDGGQMIFAATDSFRLAESRLKVKVKKDFGQVLVPFKNALEIVRILEDKDGEISVGLEKNQISLSTENIYNLKNN